MTAIIQRRDFMMYTQKETFIRPCAFFFSMFLVTFFLTKPTRVRGKKTKCPKKKKTHWLSVSDHLNDK